MRCIFGTVSLLVLVSLAPPVWANNVTAGGAYALMIGGTPSEAFLDDASPERWYRTGVVAGRSYCVETQGGVHFDTSATAFSIDTIVTVFKIDAVTVIVGDDDAADEPQGSRVSRACFTAAVSEAVLVRVIRFFTGDTFAIRVRMVETTLFSNWFFVGGDYSAWTLLRNTTNGSFTYTVNWRNSVGTIVGSSSGTIGGDDSVAIDARSIAGALAAGSGTVDVAHNGSPDAIAASTTVLSGSTGLSFDAPFIKRQSW